MNWQHEFSKFYDEKISFLHSKEAIKAKMINWIEDNIYSVSEEIAIDFAAWKEQTPKAKPIKELFSEFEKEQKKFIQQLYSKNYLEQLNKSF